jgi:hypothetical protein
LPIAGTLAEDWLRHRGIHHPVDPETLRFHPRCHHREQNGRGQDPVWTSWPAMIAAVRDDEGRLTGIHRTWLDPSGQSKAPIAKPRRSLGRLLGHGVRLGGDARIMAAGEGIETMLSLREILPHLPAIAALSASHLAAIVLPSSLRRLYLVRDDDPAGHRATAVLAQRASELGIEALMLDPEMPHRSHGDLNDALRHYGPYRLRDIVRSQLVPEDAHCRLLSSHAHGPDTDPREHSGRLSSG